MLRRLATHGLQATCLTSEKLAYRYCLSICVPTIAESISSGKVVGWTKKVGDAVAEDEIICQIESDKLNVDVRAPAAGVITKINFEEGTVVDVGAELSTMKEGEAPAAKAETADKPKQNAPAAAAPPKASPTEAAPKPAPAAAPVTSRGADPRVRSVRISSMRQRIADRLKASQNTCAMLTTFNEIDMTPLIELRNRYKDDFFKKNGVKLGFMSPFVKACAIALQDVPIVNASFGTDCIEYHDYVDISVAVSTPKGLVVPVLRDVQNSNFAQIEKQIADFGERARSNKLTMAEMTGGTFTISNGGVFGSWMGTPIVNPPQSAILGMHATKKKPWVVGNSVVPRDIMAVALTYDHRLIDGSDAVTFLVKVKNLIEDPARIVLDLA
ncbi:2-oxoglutarate dehydrogenase E2 component, putative [Trypanosoma equiperdum]|uniref:Dihydrolipoamide acetyltransferase component of pyruvate dehydrogenase complex n=3 Tax=Trypanozoon TaxID=39700 RepID=Q383B2_TRYB2|nr:2-oxoglutarate dehydrogenase E2 component dihydrolipoamide succinyltransferase [Trypanosoma brucei brucei TREU927]EAN80119.1 2-oxoglutarate dehydrogenase, E2 component, dihydrolipoamide succinyltransferase, putative [Trypanosoma brucei brucei TREU927]RHW68094.1 2-oxoglutarate dehydrogenase E2 component [Trypanosoma brucei equiperdum]SCU72413.1 2-oxoglutarate dehydrogenase E2 component, putative [Trypanosoma equiperdum]